MKRVIIMGLMGLMGLMGELQAQANRHELRDGNRQYKKEKFDQAEVAYRRSLGSDSTDYRGQYNLANALYRQKKYDDAIRHYDQALLDPALDSSQRSRVLHNKGNSYLKAGMENKEQGMQQFQQAVQSYQEALKLDPKNNNTRYNLAYARHLLKQQQQQQQQQQGGQNNQDQNKDQQNQNNQQNQQDKQNKNQQQQNQQQSQQNQNDNGQEQQEPKSQKQPNSMEQRKQDAERMLEAVKNNERATLKEQTKKLQVGNVKHSDKDW